MHTRLTAKAHVWYQFMMADGLKNYTQFCLFSSIFL